MSSQILRTYLVLGLMTCWLFVACDDGGTEDDPVDSGQASACSDGLDNDGDGLIDLDDPGCDAPTDPDETNLVQPECSDDQDNDGDGQTDFPNDPDCPDTEWDDESAPPEEPEQPQCSNGLDDDGDGQIDLADRGCGSANDPDESDDPPIPACQNGVDDDSDGFIDFPSDPGCGSEFDNDETDSTGPRLPQCGNGIDDDADGRVDLADPGCTSPADPRELDPEEPPQCSDGLDNDGDGIIDFPNEPGCSSAGDEDETNPDQPTRCSNGLDDDQDGLIDYPLDPGCAGIGDGDETDPEVTPACSDGIDNDRDDDIDYPDDRGCESAADATEGGSCGRTYEPGELVSGVTIVGSSRGSAFSSEGSCGGRGSPEVVFLYRVERPLETLRITTANEGTTLESTIYVRRACLTAQTEIACGREPLNDDLAANTVDVPDVQPGDYYIFVDGATGQAGDFALSVEEIPLAECLNHIDDDQDGRIDFPNDPGCATFDDRDETDPDPLPACSDGEDNDGDQLIDYPNDVGCRSAGDTDEVDLCGPGIRTSEYTLDTPFVLTDTSMGGANNFSAGCSPTSAPEKVFVYSNPHNAKLIISVDFEETIENTAVYVRTECQRAATEIACSVGEPRQGMTKGSVTIDRAPPGDYYIFVDQTFGLGGPVKLAVIAERLPPGCLDGIDNDEDGFIDGDDLGCTSPDDEDELNDADDPIPTCFDQIDNDGDGLIDYPFDPGCFAKGDNDETDPNPLPACANQIDDDDDGLVDFPADTGCASRGDDDEELRGRPQCANRIDDDMDGLNDYPNDPGCAAPGDLSERNDPVPPICGDQRDNDRDGLVDYPFDPGCDAAGDGDEADPDDPQNCSNGIDDDDDGLIDFPRDPGCLFAADNDENDPGFAPACANGRDDDSNGRIDWPDDPGCRFAGDLTERTDGPVLARCADGVDNDDDGVVDLADIGCVNARDNNELDPDVAPFCADGEDNDADGITDWPDDPGCAALGDECEQFGYGLCAGVCQDLLNDSAHCGRCDRVCNPGVACNGGRCGELRPVVLSCGRSNRGVENFVRGELLDAGLVTRIGCVPDEDTQAIVVSRNGINEFRNNIEPIRDWLDNGGQILTEFNVSDDIYNAVTGAQVPQGQRFGRCQENVMPVVQFSPGEPFWQDNIFNPIADEQTGCGYALNAIPDLIPLGGWDNNNISLGYVEWHAGRMWFVEANWQDNGQNRMLDSSLDLMAYMIGGGGGAGALPPCADGRDNDDDGLFDAYDPGCTGPLDEEEGDAPEIPECADGIDNDNDGIIDFPAEPGCVMAGDDDEADPVELPCANGLDDDGDGLIDYPFDPGCVGYGDNDEQDPARQPRCGNGRDDDNDLRIDYPADPGCRSAADHREVDPDEPPQCANEADDDRDGIIDWPFDIGCTDAADDDETDPDVMPECSNGIDDDENDVIDFPRDPGCAWAADNDERLRADPPACANGVDDDGNGRVDFPDDPGCRFAADTIELTNGPLPPRCDDGLDNDDDGFPDLSDIGCENRRDDDETDPEEAPFCADAIDNDEDGQIDWPADEGCAAQGDVCEQHGHGLCDDVCTDLLNSPLHCGRCGRSCSEGVECLEGRCGELRQVILACARSGRQLQSFIRGELVEAEIVARDGCIPDDETQAILVPRGGIGQFVANAQAIREWVNDGGVVISEYNISDEIYNAMFQANVAQGMRNGSCTDDLMPVIQFTPNDPFWLDNLFVATPANQSGCGHNVGNFPGVTPVGGWDANNVSIAYRNLGAGRVWLVDIDWQDGQNMPDASLDLMSYMITGGR